MNINVSAKRHATRIRLGTSTVGFRGAARTVSVATSGLGSSGSSWGSLLRLGAVEAAEGPRLVRLTPSDSSVACRSARCSRERDAATHSVRAFLRVTSTKTRLKSVPAMHLRNVAQTASSELHAAMAAQRSAGVTGANTTHDTYLLRATRPTRRAPRRCPCAASRSKRPVRARCEEEERDVSGERGVIAWRRVRGRRRAASGERPPNRPASCPARRPHQRLRTLERFASIGRSAGGISTEAACAAVSSQAVTSRGRRAPGRCYEAALAAVAPPPAPPRPPTPRWLLLAG